MALRGAAQLPDRRNPGASSTAAHLQPCRLQPKQRTVVTPAAAHRSPLVCASTTQSQSRPRTWSKGKRGLRAPQEQQPAGYVDPAKEPLPFWAGSKRKGGTIKRIGGTPAGDGLGGEPSDDDDEEESWEDEDQQESWSEGAEGAALVGQASVADDGASWSEVGSDAQREQVAALKRDFPWLFTARAREALGVPLRNQYAHLLRSVVPLLMHYDVASPQGRPPHLGTNPRQIIEPPLTARAAARWEAAQRTPQTLSHEVFISTPNSATSLEGSSGNGTDGRSMLDSHTPDSESASVTAGDARRPSQLMLPLDNRWAQREAEQASYLAYMHELRRALSLPEPKHMLPAGTPEQERPSAKEQWQARKRGAKGAPQQQQQQQQQQEEQQQRVRMDSAQAAQLDMQLEYQVGVCDDWLQLSHLAAVFEDVLGPRTAAALYKRTVAVTPVRVVSTWGPSERIAFSAFTKRLALSAADVVPNMSPRHVGQVAYGVAVTEQLKSAAAGVPAPESNSVLLPPMAAASGAATAGGPVSPQAFLLSRLCSHATQLLQQQHDRQDPRRKMKGSSSSSKPTTGARPPSDSAQKGVDGTLSSSGVGATPGAAAAAADEASAAQASPNVGTESSLAMIQQAGAGMPALAVADERGAAWTAADYAQLLWGLGSVGHVPPRMLLQRACSTSYLSLDRFQPSQLWGMLWGMARLSRASGFLPDRRWLTRFLKACSRVMGEFDADGLSNLIWSIAALQCVIPERDWMRQFVGACHARIRSFQAASLVQLVEALAVLGYTPRDELCNSIMGQIRRQMHTMSGAQLSVVLRAIALAPRWRPYRQFLYDFVVQAQPKLRSMNASQASGILWAFAKFGYLPEPSFTAGLASQMALALPQRPLAQLGPQGPPSLQAPPSSPAQLSTSTTTSTDDGHTSRTALATHHTKPQGSTAAEEASSVEESSSEQTSGGVHVPAAAATATGNNGSGQSRTALAQSPKPPGLSLFSGADGNALSMALWAMAELRAHDALRSTLLLRQRAQPGPYQQRQQQQQQQQQWVPWIEAWLERATEEAPRFSGPAAANSMWALAVLGVRPPPALLDALLLRISALLPELGPQDMVQVASGLATMQYRPSDAWLASFITQCRTHLAALAGDDLGKLLWCLAELGSPMDQEWLLAYCREAARGWSTHTGESLGLMAWGLSQYDFSPFSNANPESGPAPAAPVGPPGSQQVLELPPTRHDTARLQQQGQQAQQQAHQQQAQAVLAMTRKEEAWWSGFYKACGGQWHTASARTLTLMLFGVAHLVCSAPDREWQRGLMRAIRLRIARPATSDAVIPTLLAAAGLVPEAAAPPSLTTAITAGQPLSSSSSGVSMGASPLVLSGTTQGEPVSGFGSGGGGGTGATADAVSWAPAQAQQQQQQQGGQQQVAVCPPPMSKAQVLAVLPPKAAQSVWLAAFLSELKSQWGFPRAL